MGVTRPYLAALAATAILASSPVLAEQARASSFAVRLPITVSKDATSAAAATLALGSGDGRIVVMKIGRSQLSLSERTKAKDTALWQDKVALAAGGHVLMLKQSAAGLSVCLDARQLARLPARMPRRPKAKFLPAPGVTADGRPRVQPTAEVWFTDDFARGTAEGLQWETVSGRFAINGSLNPGSSQSAFQLWGGAPEGRALAVAEGSHWFWDDYRVGVSAKCVSLPATWGLVFHYVDAANYHLLKWSQVNGKPGLVQLIRRRAGKEELLGKHVLSQQPDQWYRMTVVTHGTVARAYVGGTQVARVDDPALVGGRIGVFVEKTPTVYFDDVAVASVGPVAMGSDWQLPQPFGPCERQWSDFAKKSFFTDRFMVQWAHPRCSWEAPATRGAALAWFRTRFFHDVTLAWERGRAACHWPRKPLEIVLFGDRTKPKSGYRLRVEAKRVVFAKAAKVVAESPLDVQKLSSLEFSASTGEIAFRANGKTLVQWKDPSPLTQGMVAANLGPMRGMSLSWPDWRDGARVKSTHRLDYSFDHAPTAWEVQSGRWRGTHRWACVPRWSFFSGRGRPGAPGTDHANVNLWNLRRFKGDFDLELFVAPMEGTPQRIHFAWPITLNVAFAGDGRRLDSGYMFHFGTCDLPSRLYRAGREIGTWNRRADPTIRLDAMLLYHQMTQVWQHLRIQRRGPRVLVDIAKHNRDGNYGGLERAFDVTDPQPLNGDRIGLWTWGPNGMAIARATISYAESPGVASLREMREGRQQGDVAVRQMTEGGKTFARVHNLCSGGSFVYDLTQAPVDLDKTGTLEFDYRVSPQLALSLMASVRGHTAELVLCGPERYRPTTIPLGCLSAAPVQPGKWHHAAFDLRSALRKAFPNGPLVIDRLILGSPYETLQEIGGLGVNREGVHHDLANVRWQASPAVKQSAAPAQLEILVNDMEPLDDFERDLGSWAQLGGWDGAALYRDPHEPGSRRYSLRLLNQKMGGTAGAWVTRTPYDLSAFPRIAFAYRIPSGVEVNLVVRANGRWFEIRATGTDASWSVAGSFADLKADGSWRRAELDLYAALRRWLRTDRIRVESLAWADSRRMSTRQGIAYWIDDFCRVPAIDPARPTQFKLQLSTGKPIAAYSHVVDNAPTTAPPSTPTRKGDALALAGNPGGRFLHVRAQTEEGGWTEPLHLPIVPGKIVPAAEPQLGQQAATPSLAPFVSYIPSDRLCRTEFEWAKNPEFPEQHLGEFCIRREAWVLRCEDDAATGSGSVEFLNLSPNGFYSGYFRTSAWNPERWPRVAFDYKFERPGCALNLSMLVNDAMTVVEWTGANRRGNYFSDSVVGRTEWARQDGKWHHVEFDLLDMILKTRLTDPQIRGEIAVAELATWATSHSYGTYTNPLGARDKIDNFTIFSPRGRNPAFAWRVHAPCEMKGYSYVFDQSTNTVPPEKVRTQAKRAGLKNVKPGTWYLHVRACGQDGRWGESAHRKIEIKP